MKNLFYALMVVVGVSFLSWNTLSNGSGTSYSDGSSYSFTTDVTLYAQWTALPTHTVTFNANGDAEVHYGWGRSDFFTIDHDTYAHLRFSYDWHGGTSIDWTNDAPVLDTDHAHLAWSNGHAVITGITASDDDAGSSELYTLTVGDNQKTPDTLGHILQNGIEVPDGSNGKLAVKITDSTLKPELFLYAVRQARGAGLSGTFGGDSSVYRSRRGVERRLWQFTIVLLVLFVIFSITAFVIAPSTSSATGA